MKLYIETSVVSFWYDRHSRNREKRRAPVAFFSLVDEASTRDS